MKKLLNVVSTALVVAVVLTAVAAIFYSVAVSNGSGVSFFGYRCFRVITGSMTPEYPVGTVVVCKQVEPSSLVVGDVITFYATSGEVSGYPVTHQIVKVDNVNGEYQFTTKGIANDLPDANKVTSKDIFGKVIKKSAFLTFVLSIFDRKWAYPVFIILPLLLILAYTTKQYVKVLKEHLKEKEEHKIEN